MSEESFRLFNQAPDPAEFLDTKEDIEQYRINAADNVIERFCNACGISEALELKAKPEYLEALIANLLQKTNLSHRQVAKHLEISSSVVHRVSLDFGRSAKEV